MPRINPTLPADGDDAIVEPYNAAITLILSVLNGSIDSDNIAANSIGVGQLSTALQGFLVPTGVINAYGGATAPTGWLMCDGSSQLRASFSTLFAIIGTSFGSADGTHFNVPDLRGRVAIGNDAMSGTTANRIERSTTLTTTSGSATATAGSATGLAIGMKITAVGVPAGTTIASFNGTTITMSANATANGSLVAARFSMLGNDAEIVGATGGEDVHVLAIKEMAPLASKTYLGDGSWDGISTFGGSSIHLNNILPDNSGQAHNNLPPAVVTNYIIKT